MSGTVIHYIKQQNHFLKLLSDCFVTLIVFNITSCIDMDSFSDTFKAVILVTFYIVLCLQNKTFVDRVQKYFGSGNCCGKSTKNLASLLCSFFPVTYLTYYSGIMLLSTVLKSVKFILSFFLVFLNTEYLCFSLFNVFACNIVLM